MSKRHALVLGGGGLAGTAWITGLLAGLAEAGDDVTAAEVIIGTSAGAVVAAQLGSSLPLPELFARQADPERQTAEVPATADLRQIGARIGAYLAGARTRSEVLRAIGQFALAADTPPETGRLAGIRSRLPDGNWPARLIRLTAVDCETGELTVFDRDSGVPLADAVAASCAVPGVWPPVSIGGRRYLDGGVRSSDNADLATGYDRVTIISPSGLRSALPSPLPLPEVVARLRADGSDVTVVSPDEASAAAFGANPLDPATRTPAALAGLAQGRAGLAACAIALG